MSGTERQHGCSFAGKGESSRGSRDFGSEAAGRLMRSFSLFKKKDWEQSMISGFTTGEIRILMVLKYKEKSDGGHGFESRNEGDPGLKVSQISNHMKVTSPTITQFINGLEAKGLVERVMDKNDRRAVRVRLTEEGEKVVHLAHDAFKANFEGLVAHLGEADSDLLADLLTKVYDYMSKAEIQFHSPESK